MLEKIASYIKENKLAEASAKIIVTVSGGLDSVVLADVLHKLKYEIAIAHCNFGLRGEESEADELFVKKLAKKYEVPFYSEHFSTQAFADEHGLSIQMAARQLRYSWFEKLRQELGFDFIATAHHQNDTLETILLNLTRGTGLAGLHGIPPKNGNLIRPLLCMAKDDLYDYLVENRLAWREDASNETTKYQRNLLRHEVVPVLKKLNPNLEETIFQTSERIRGAEAIFERYVSEAKNRAVKETDEATYINVPELETSLSLATVLHELLKPYHFPFEKSKQIAANLHNASGTQFDSPTHHLVIDREQLVITPKDLRQFASYEISETDTELQADNFTIKLKRVPAEGYKIPKGKKVAALDAALLQFPLKLRPWQEGDWFVPLGMNGKKKISDLLIDQKVPLNLKAKVLVLSSAQSIAWVVGLRPDNRFKVSEKTEEVLEVWFERK
ncbi:tRNA lysidine(34) synthetase TilS [Adhaeribacter sp. BT258]|uniref:tRNA(Ile)-lysidine synthase n=1 Tax=Adhaeribacter terrigena TaxID=2793070 RepID=A0ABS1BX96_9BACT|nr:tRNA lysidine(34) synthetase TilS [Adhaeribacter terrigena]MBK0401761.1 tRNA lysidine(34) synthetase TilS [Adhaeribacter terrigena]